MGTGYSITLLTLPADQTRENLQTAIDDRLAAINRVMSTYDPQSELSQFNRSDRTGPIPASPELRTVLSAALELSRISQGAFDATVAPLVNLWGFGPGAGEDRLPTDDEIDQARNRVGFERIQVDDSAGAIRKTRPDVIVDLSAIAKGYAVDQIGDYLESLGASDYLVEIGGELRLKGNNPRGESWSIAIEKPVAGERSIKRIVQISDKGMATSGDYRNFFEIDGQRYSHAIDPDTGRPVRHTLASVTVLADNCMLADGWATALLVLGPDAGRALAEQQQLAALFIVITPQGFEEQPTTAFQPYLSSTR